MTTYWTDNENEGVPDDDDLLDAAIANPRTTPDEEHDAILGLLGLIQMIAARPDCPPEIRKAMLENHRYVEGRTVAKAYL